MICSPSSASCAQRARSRSSPPPRRTASCRCWHRLAKRCGRRCGSAAMFTGRHLEPSPTASGCRNAPTPRRSIKFCRRRTSAGSSSTRMRLRSPSRGRGARSSPRASHPEDQPRLPAIPNPAGRSGAPSPVTRATRSTATSIATSGLIFPRKRSFRTRSCKTPRFTGLKYHRITGREGEKQLYHRAWAEEAATAHAAHFLASRRQQLRELGALDFDPILTIPFDAELFGHWWYEGPLFLEQFIRQAAAVAR